jgi:hypothetical protein
MKGKKNDKIIEKSVWFITAPGYGVLNEKVKKIRDELEEQSKSEIELIGKENDVDVYWFGDIVDVPNGRIRLGLVRGREDDIDRFLLFIIDQVCNY